MTTVAITLSCIALLFLILEIVRKARYLRIARERRDQDIQDFLVYFAEHRIPQSLLERVYRYLQSFAGMETFSVHPNDDLSRVYGIVNEDLDDMILKLAWSALRFIAHLRADFQTALRAIKPVIVERPCR
jgi:hypothetical protein